ncbi:MAG: heavy-metal-associated domain-containing protein [Erysipelotrichia bacterium]|nr:heavy-metal-associated domain-containing protein [Erysipelotrichia bacterium]
MKIFILFLMLANLIFASNISVFKVEGMHCPLCTTAVKKAIKELDGVQKVSARLNTKEVSVIYDEKLKIDEILKAIKTTSYEGVEISTKSYEK